MRRGRPVTHADKEHIHHRLMDFGHSHRQAVLLMYLWSGLISAVALAVALLDGRLLVGGIGVAALLIIIATAIPRAWPRIRAARRSSPEEDEQVEPVGARPDEPGAAPETP
jgi:UDP-GlcNAc:undecaprenyl-phosphate GlcNAc-1-phosphate transferase